MPTTVATPGDITKLQRQIDALGGRLSALEASVVTPPPSPPPPPSLPPPPPPLGLPPIDLLPVAGLNVPLAGHVRVGVAVAPGIIKTVGRVCVGDIEGQVDNPVFDRDGWLRWFLLSAILPAGTYRIAISPMALTAAPVQSISPQVSIVGMGQVTRVADWRSGSVVTESVWRAPIGSDGLTVQICESLWVDGKSDRTIIYENARSIPGEIAARTLTYDGVVHVPYTRWLRREGEQDVFAEVVPLAGGTIWDHLRVTRLLQNFATAPNAPSLAPLAALTDRPFAVSDAGSILHFTRSQGAPGANPDIGPHPAYYLGALAHFDADMLRLICANADARMGAAAFFRDVKTGTFHRPDDGVDICFHPAWGNPVVGRRASDDTVSPNQGWAGSHWGAMFYIPYLLTGRLEYLEGQVAQQALSWIGSSYANCGSQMHRHSLNFNGVYTEQFIGGQERPQLRTQAWAARTTIHTEALLPHDDIRVRALLGWDKSTVRALWSNVCADLKRLYIDDNTGEGKRFAVDGCHFIVDDNRSKQWQIGMLITALGHGVELGVLSTEGMAFYRWLAVTHLGVAAIDHPYRDRMIGCDNWYKQDVVGRSARSIVDMIEACVSRGSDVFASQESDWAGYIWTIVSMGLDNGLPNATTARAYLLARSLGRPGSNHYIEPRG